MNLPHHLIQQILVGKAILFLGAGASSGATSNTPPKVPPLGRELANLLSDKFLGGDSKEKSLAMIAEYSIDASDLRTFQRYIAEVFNSFEPSDVQKAIADFRWAGIFTTNFDQILEKAYSANKKRLQTPVPVLRSSDRVDQEVRAPDAVQLIKLHGCVTVVDDDRLPLILTIDQYITHRTNRKKLFDRFSELAGEYSVVYVGYQIEDADIRAILLELAAPDMSRPIHYVVTPHPSERDTKIWLSKRVETISGTFAEFMQELQAQIPAGLRGVRTTAKAHPIAKRFTSHAVPSEDLLTFLATDVFYISPDLPSESPNATAFYRGAAYGWSSTIANLDAKRTLSDTILSEAVLIQDSDRPRSTDCYLIDGYAGSGKSVLLKRLAYDTAITFDKVVLYVRGDSRPLMGPIIELCSLIGERLFLFIDGVVRRAGEFESFLREARSRKLSLTIIIAERTNEWNVDGESLSLVIDGNHTLRSLSASEIDALLAKLEVNKCLGELSTKTPLQRREAFLNYANRQLLVALYEVTSGTPFQDIVFDEYRGIVNDRARRIYLLVCSLNRMNVPVRAGLIHRLTGVSFNDFKKDFFGPLESVVLTEEYKPAMDMAYRSRHPWVAQIVFERALATPAERFDLYISVLREIDIGYTADRSAFRESVKAKNLRELFSDPLMVEEIFRVAGEASPEDGYLLQQRAIYEIKRPNGNLQRAHDLINTARGLLPHDKSITHTFSELAVARANAAKTKVERDVYFEQARQHALRLTGSSAVSGHGHGTLVRLAIAKLREVLDVPVGNDEDVTAATKAVEQALTAGLQQFRSDEHLLSLEAEYAGMLQDGERAIKALMKAVSKNAASAFVAKALSRVYETQANYGAARSTLEDALRIIPGDKPLNGALARLLDRNFHAEGREAEACWRRSFTEGDTNYTSQFWFARRLYLNEKTDESLDRFSKLKLVHLPRAVKTKISGRIRDDAGILKVFKGVISRLEDDFALVTPFGQQRQVMLHCSEVPDDRWKMLRRSDALNFTIGFNYLGPAAKLAG